MRKLLLFIIVAIFFSCDNELENSKISTLTITAKNPYYEKIPMKSLSEVPEFTPSFGYFYVELRDMNYDIAKDIYDVDCKVLKNDWSNPSVEFTVQSGQYHLVGYSSNVQNVVGSEMYIHSDSIISINGNVNIDFQIHSISAAYAILKNKYIAPSATRHDIKISAYYKENGVSKSLESYSTIEDSPNYYSRYVNPAYQLYDVYSGTYTSPTIQFDSVTVIVPTTLGTKRINCGSPQQNTLYRIIIDYSNISTVSGDTLGISLSKGPILTNVVEIEITE